MQITRTMSMILDSACVRKALLDRAEAAFAI